MFSNKQMESVLKALVAKETLTYDDILGGYDHSNSLIRNSLLHVHHDMRNHTLMCGGSPHSAARIITE